MPLPLGKWQNIAGVGLGGLGGGGYNGILPLALTGTLCAAGPPSPCPVYRGVSSEASGVLDADSPHTSPRAANGKPHSALPPQVCVCVWLATAARPVCVDASATGGRGMCVATPVSGARKGQAIGSDTDLPSLSTGKWGRRTRLRLRQGAVALT